MEALFLQVLNMSITAGYVILAVLLVRLLLKQAPKKYSYLLWSVVAFRLICPVSFSSGVSIFNVRPFDMTVAQSGGGAALRYIPTDIGYMATPKVTVGIPLMNSAISERLPGAVPAASVNPLQIWIWLGTLLWCAGVVVLLVYSIATFIRLRRHVATAVRLEGHVFESDRVQLPFVLGFVRPRIYIPFGLGAEERTYILQHEEYHLARRDYLIKPLAFLVLAVHWFNPLVWIAFMLMTRDMEMSCDEKVLSVTGAGVAKAYSTSLLSFAAHRRFPAASPLAFGETSIRERVRNVLRFEKPKRWVVVLAAALCVVAVAACATNPQENAAPPATEELYGNYVFEKQVYMNPLSSFIAFDGYKEYYTFTKDGLTITEESGSQRSMAVKYERVEVDEQAFKAGFMMDMGVPDISKYKGRYQYTLTDAPSAIPAFRLYLMDDEVWLAHWNSEYTWSIYKIARYDGELPAPVVESDTQEVITRARVSGTEAGVEDFLALQGDFESGYDVDTCYNITPAFIKENSDYSVFKYDTSCASFLLYEGEVYPLGEWFGGLGVTSMALADMDGDGTSELYFTYSWGSGIHRSHVAYFDPVAKRTVTLDYAHMNEDMMVVDNGRGGLSLYDARLTDMADFVSFNIEAVGRLADLAFVDGEVQLVLDPNEQTQ